MRGARVWVISTLSFAVTTLPLIARANPELAAQYDARSVGMGGTGTAFLEGASGGVYFNPALLDGVERFEAALTLSPFIPMLEAPFAQPGTNTPTDTQKTETAVVPLGLVAVGLRVHERIAIGLGVYVASGVGGEYKNVGILDAAATAPAKTDDFDDFKLEVAVIETALPISVRITKDLSIGATWRTGYTMQSTTVVVPNPAAPGLVNRIDQELSGFSVLGASLGVRYRPIKMLSFGLDYRSKMTMDLEGTTNVEANAVPPMVPSTLVADADTTSEWSTPHQLRAGVALSLLSEKLLLALDGRAQLYEDANEALKSEVELDGQPLMVVAMTDRLQSTTMLGWKNAYAAQIGAEVQLLPVLALRAGFSLGNSASNEKYPAPVAPPPGLLSAVTAGVGATFTHWQAGIAGSYQHGSATVETSDIATGPGGAKVAPAGTYEANLLVIAASCGYRM